MKPLHTRTLTSVLSDLLNIETSDARTLLILVVLLIFAVLIGRAMISPANQKRSMPKRKLFLAAGALVMVIMFGVLAVNFLTDILPHRAIETALAKGDYQRAAEIYLEQEMYDEAREIQLLMAEKALAAGDYTKAIDVYEKQLYNIDLADEARFARAQAALKQQHTALALPDLVATLSRPYTAALLLEDPATRLALFAPGSTIQLPGRVPSGATTWHVLACESNRVLLLCSNFGESPYAVGMAPVTWETSLLRESIYAFRDERLCDAVQAAMLPVQLTNTRNDQGVISPAPVTVDTIFAPSDDELMQYLLQLAQAVPNMTFWTRTPCADYAHSAIMVTVQALSENKTKLTRYSSSTNMARQVFPVMWLDLNALLQGWAE